MNQEAKQLIDLLDLQPHPEGGFFKEVYRSRDSMNLKEPYNGTRNFSTSIYFMLTSDTFSAFHKINQDEIWHFYKGSPITLHMISPVGNHTMVTIGNNIDRGEVPQFVVPGGHYFGAILTEPNTYALVGCTVSPGFDFADFELSKPKDFLDKFPQHATIITQLTR